MTLRKLSSPASDDEMRKAHSNLLKEIGEISQDADESNGSLAISIVKGLQFVLQQIQVRINALNLRFQLLGHHLVAEN